MQRANDITFVKQDQHIYKPAELASTAATDVGMHGLLASQYRVTILCCPLVCVHCGPVVDFFITKQTSLHPFDFVRNFFIYFKDNNCAHNTVVHKVHIKPSSK